MISKTKKQITTVEDCRYCTRCDSAIEQNVTGKRCKACIADLKRARSSKK